MVKRTVKIVLISIAAMVLLFFAAQIFWAICQHAWQPEINPNERWVSQDPDIWFIAFDEDRRQPYGQIMIGDQIIEISPDIIYGDRLEILDYPTKDPDVITNADILMYGRCTFYIDWFTCEIQFDRDGLFEDISTITFRKVYVDGNAAKYLQEPEGQCF